MTTTQSHTCWVPRMLMAAACTATCMLLSATAAYAGTSTSSPVAHSSSTTSQTARSATTARAAAVRVLAARTDALHTCRRVHPHHCAGVERDVARAARGVQAMRHPARSTGSARHLPTAPTNTETPTNGPPTAGKEPGTPTAGKEPLPPIKEAPTLTNEPPPPVKETPPQSSTTFQPGLNSGANMHEDLQGAVILGAKVVRVAWSIDTPAAAMESVIAGYASKGIRVQPLAEFYETLPTPSEAQNLASWARAYGPGGTFWAGRSDGQLAIKAIEFGNETASEGQYNDRPGEASFYARAQIYALRFREAAEATATTGTGVGLLAQDEDQSGAWMNGMYSAVPNLSKYVAGWTIHPYGGEQYNRERLDALIAQTAEHGASTIPVDITEWGVATDNGHCLNFNEGFNFCMSFEEAAQTLKSTVTWISKLLGSRLGDFFIYQVRDQRATGAATNCQDYYGALQHELQPKGAYTTQIQALLSSSTP